MIHDRGEVDYFGSRDTYTLDCGHYRLDYLAVIALYKPFLNFYMDHCAIVLPSGLTSRHSVLGVGGSSRLVRPRTRCLPKESLTR
jgi:hypothetical protein